MTRRNFVPALAGIGLGAAALAQTPPATQPPAFQLKATHGRIKQSVTSGVFAKGTPFEDQCRMAKDMGIQGFDLQPPERWPILKQFGLVSSMSSGGGGTIPVGLNRKENHDTIEKVMRPMIDQCAAFGSPNLITFSGVRKGMSDAEGIDNCVLFLNKVKAQAEDKNVNICMELLNSRVNHPDYQCDHVDWGVEVCKRVNSPRVKLLFDIYHMQIMDGDITRRVRTSIQWLAHFHTGGVPGRHELDNESQELNYHFVANAIADAGFEGFVGHEYSPLRDPKTSLQEAIEIFTV